MDEPTDARDVNPERWVERHGAYLYRYALARVRRPDAAEDVVQQALLAALDARARFAGRCSERTWLTAILKRKAADWLRAAARREARAEPLPDEWADAQFTARGQWARQPGAWSAADPARELASAEFRAVLGACLDKLPPRLARAFVLRHVDEESAEFVRNELGATATNLGVMLHRARLRLWRCVSTNWFGDADGAPAPGSDR
jgi:RNA polymerase sigma-70 factor (TIGR02943 family)